MNTFRFETSSQGWLSADSRGLSNSIEAAAAGPDLQQLAGDIARMAAQDPTRACEVVRDFFTLTPASPNGEFASAVVARLDDAVLSALAQAPAGRELIVLLDDFCSAASNDADQPAQWGRLRNAQSAAAQVPADFSWAGLSLPQNLRPALLDSLSQLQSAPHGATGPEEQVKSAFQKEFAAKAANKEEFDAFMQQVFGDKYDKNLAEQYRQQALNGDFSFLPDVEFVDAATLQGGKGAYNEAEGVVYINRDIAASDPHLAAQVFVEEAGAHLDAKLNTVDTQGDEGEMFRRVLGGEHLSAREIDAIHDDDDHGTITVDGKQVEVEFWFGEDIVDAASDAVDAVGSAASDAVDAVGSAAGDVVDYVGNAARDAVYEIGDAFKEVGMGIINAAEIFMKGLIVDVIGGVFMNLLNGHVADAFDSFIIGIDKMAFQTTRRLFNAALTGVGHYFKTFTRILPNKFGGELARNLIDRASDVVRTVGNGVVDIARNTWRMPFELVGGFAQDIGGALKYWARGDLGGGFERLGLAFVNPIKRAAGTIVDDTMIVGQGVGNVITAFNPEAPPSRGLSKDEREYLKSVYGDSLNLEDIRIHRGNISHKLGAPAPHTVGNDIYIPDNEPGKPQYWNEDGSLTEEGKLLLVHEGFHAYQAQKGGNDYIHDALIAQMQGIAQSGNRNAGYDFTKPLKEGKPFNEWNPEQQAEFIETMTRARDAKLEERADINGDGRKETSFDFNRDGRIDAFELNMAWYDQNGDGNVDDGKFVNRWLSQEDVERANAIWNTLKDDRPDRTLTA
jgi:hypothetical protein